MLQNTVCITGLIVDIYLRMIFKIPFTNVDSQ